MFSRPNAHSCMMPPIMQTTEISHATAREWTTLLLFGQIMLRSMAADRPKLLFSIAYFLGGKVLRSAHLREGLSIGLDVVSAPKNHCNRLGPCTAGLLPLRLQ